MRNAGGALAALAVLACAATPAHAEGAGTSATGSTTAGADAETGASGRQRPRVPGEMSGEEARAHFRELREFMRQRHDRPLTIALTAGYGWAISPPGVTPYRAGLGASLGYTVPMYNAYLGVSGLYHGGESLDAPANGESTELPGGDYSSLRVTADAGYELIFRHVRLRAVAMGGSGLVVTPTRKTVLPTLGVRGDVLVPMDALLLGANVRLEFLLGDEAAASHVVTWLGVIGVRL